MKTNDRRLVVALLMLWVAPALSATTPSIVYRWKNVQIGGGGFVSGIVFHPAEKSLYYARTDVGGAYRWEQGEQRWVPITDWIGSPDWNLTGIESIALDPTDPQRVYLAAGTYTHERAGNGAILRSADRGKTFARADLPFKLGANELGRGNGERLAVDPDDGRNLYLGSRGGGLWKSTDHGATWSNVKSFPKVATSESATVANRWRRQPIGIVFVTFDNAGGKVVIYAGVSTKETSLFRSRDGGATWRAVPGQPVGLRPNHMVRSSDGTFYLSYGDEPGPDTMTRGAVWKFSPTGNRWTDITPAPQSIDPDGFGWGAVAVDAQNPNILLASTFCHYKPRDEIFRSLDGGKTWRALFEKSTWDHSASKWTQHHTPHWIGDVEINPFDSNHALFVTGYGIWASRNLLATDAGTAPVNWWFQNTNLEETVSLGLISPPRGAHLLSAMGDLDGFRHDNLTVAPLQFGGPRFSNSEDITYAERAPNVIARVGRIRQWKNEVRGAYSQDGGTTWKAFTAEPPEGGGEGKVALSADGKRIVWTPIKSGTYVSIDWGRNWTKSQGLPPRAQVVADRRDANRFYAYDAASGDVFVSRDGAENFRVLITAPVKNDGVTLHTAADALYLASRSQGLFRLRDGRDRFEPLPAVEEAASLGQGKAAPGHAGPTLYLAGRVNGVTGLFRSDNEVTWIRINDDAHQFGRINHVTGDPRIYGRVYFATGGRGVFYGDPQ